MADTNWRQDLPVLAGRAVVLREPDVPDTAWMLDVLSIADASRFGLPAPVSEASVGTLVASARADRAAGLAFTYGIALSSTGRSVGLIQVRRLDPAFEIAEWEATLAPSARGASVFMEAARLVGSFLFDVVGSRRIECRVLLQNGRANGALRKLGAVEEGVLRRAARHQGEYLDQVLWSILKEDWAGPEHAAAAGVH